MMCCDPSSLVPPSPVWRNRIVSYSRIPGVASMAYPRAIVACDAAHLVERRRPASEPAPPPASLLLVLRVVVELRMAVDPLDIEQPSTGDAAATGRSQQRRSIRYIVELKTEDACAHRRAHRPRRPP